MGESSLLRGSGIRSGIVVSQRYIDTEHEHSRTRSLVAFRVTPSFQAGIEYNAGPGQVGFMANWFAARETNRTPAVILGTSADRLGTGGVHITYVDSDPGGGSGGGDHGHEAASNRGTVAVAHFGPKNPRAYYLTLSKQLGRIPMAPYVSLNYSETDRGFNFPSGQRSRSAKACCCCRAMTARAPKPSSLSTEASTPRAYSWPGTAASESRSATDSKLPLRP